MDKAARDIQKYCETYAEADIVHLHSFPASRRFKHLIVVPAYREAADFLARLKVLAARNTGTLVVLVINQPEGDTDTEINNALLKAAGGSGHPEWQSGHLSLRSWPNDSCLLLVDRFNELRRVPDKQGVGLARKVGCDIAAALRNKGQVTARYIHNTDADAILPADYLLQNQQQADASALLYPFRHTTADTRLGEASKAYEDSLHYYVSGLKWAGSPYAFHTIGSCIAISLHHYCLARGFPKRAGGEDFYLLNKLAKLGAVIGTKGAAIELQARESTRVPFGTGPAVARILALNSPTDFRTYNPQVFVELKSLLTYLIQLSQHPGDDEGWLASLPPAIGKACRSLGVEQLLRHLAMQADTESQYRKHTHDWFDGFRTLKFVHYMQEHHHPPVALNQALAEAKGLLV